MVVLKTDYSNCPLKKRPLSIPYDNGTTGNEQTEPQDLSIKCAKDDPDGLQEPPGHVSSPQEPFSQVMHMEKSFVPVIRSCETTTQPCMQISQVKKTSSQSECKQDPAMQVLQLLSNAHTPELCTEATNTAQVTCPTTVHTQKPHIQTTVASRNITQQSTIQNPHPLRHLSTPYSTSSPIQVYKTKDSHEPVPESVSFSRSNVITTPSIFGEHASENRNSRNLYGKDVSNRDKFSEQVFDVGTSRICHGSLNCFPLQCDSDMKKFPPQQTHSDHLSRMPTDVSFSRLYQAVTSSCIADPIPSSIRPTQAAPHRPWLAEGPLRPIPRTFPDLNVPIPPARPRPILPGSPGLWAGVVPLSWPVPSLLASAHTTSHGRHQRECQSPGSESASSDGSSGGGRGEARYSCTDCSKSYSTYSGLSKHKQFHCAALGTKSFACKHCEKVYTSLGALKMHIRTHTLPCKCHLCGKAFSRPWLLQGHIRTHTGEKPFQCSQCDRCFADRSNLRAHLQTHAHVKKYACSTCHKTFSRMSLLNKHTEAACPTLNHHGLP